MTNTKIDKWEISNDSNIVDNTLEKKNSLTFFQKERNLIT